MRVAYLLRSTIALPLFVAACSTTPPKSSQVLVQPAEAQPVGAQSAEAQPAQTQPAASTAASAGPRAATAASSSVDAGVTAAESWLALVDAAKYRESWQAAAPLLQKAISTEDWLVAASKARTPFGKLTGRQLRSASFQTALPGLPDGKYVVIRYLAAFENGAHATETITPMQSDDGSWKVAGYYIKPG